MVPLESIFRKRPTSGKEKKPFGWKTRTEVTFSGMIFTVYTDERKNNLGIISVDFITAYCFAVINIYILKSKEGSKPENVAP